MKILHIDTGRDLRGGQHQILLLLQGLKRREHQQQLAAGLALRERWPSFPPDPIRLFRASRRADIVHAHDGRAHKLAALFCPRRPLVVSRRVAFPLNQNWGSRWKYAKPQAIVAVSEHVREILEHAGIPSNRLTTVYDGVAVPAAEPREPKGTTGNQAPLVITPWLDDPLKGAEWLEVACQAAGARLKRSRDLLADLPDADLFLYVTQSEGLGSAILLAMAHQVPVVASRVGGIPEIVVPEMTGLLTGNTCREVTAALERFLKRPDLARRCARSAFEMVRTRFSDNEMVERTENIYRAVLDSEPLA